MKKGLVVDVQIPGQKGFQVAVNRAGSPSRAYGIIPLKNAGVPAIEVSAEQTGRNITVALSAIRGEFDAKKDCQSLRALPREKLDVLVIRGHSPVKTAALSRYGVASVSFLIMQGVEDCCGCSGTLYCCPSPGHCLECGNCGKCCNSGPKPIQP